MKKKLILMVLPLLLAGCMAEREDAGSPPYIREAVVTAMQDGDGTVFLLMQGMKLLPYEDIGYEGPGRAMCSLTIFAEQMADYDRRAQVHWIEWLDKGITGPGDMAADYDSDPQVFGAGDGIDPLLDSWITSVEDGYLTLHYNAWWGDESIHHGFYLLTGTDPDDPYRVRLCHDANGDTRETYSDGIVYFDLNSLPPTGEDAARLTLEWTDTKGKESSAYFDFRTRK